MNWKAGPTIAVASLVPVAPAFEAASNALKGTEAYALKEANEHRRLEPLHTARPNVLPSRGYRPRHSVGCQGEY